MHVHITYERCHRVTSSFYVCAAPIPLNATLIWAPNWNRHTRGVAQYQTWQAECDEMHLKLMVPLNAE